MDGARAAARVPAHPTAASSPAIEPEQAGGLPRRSSKGEGGKRERERVWESSAFLEATADIDALAEACEGSEAVVAVRDERSEAT
jgi:hypothetical protein